MKAKQIAVRFGVTKNMGNYESLRMDYEMVVHLDPEDKPSEAIDHARNYLNKKMKQDIAASDGGTTWVK
ncbi:MAG: hypothetical protein ACPKM1_15765 [Spirochaetaceae bacterium]